MYPPAGLGRSGVAGRLGAAGREKARDFAPEAIAAKVTEVYRSVLAERVA